MKYRKKPVVVEAVQWTGNNYIEIDNFITVKHETNPSLRVVKIPTLEGVMEATPNDYIIKGVQGEFYPCKPDIFEATYEKAEPLKTANITVNIDAKSTEKIEKNIDKAISDFFKEANNTFKNCL